jgi:hypothetical protein
MVNILKSVIFFSANCQEEIKAEVMEITGICTEALLEKYLGLPTALGRSTKEAFTGSERLRTGRWSLPGVMSD